jgi:hypothetical protein
MSPTASPPLKKGDLGGFEAGDSNEGEVAGNVTKEDQQSGTLLDQLAIPHSCGIRLWCFN